MSIFAEIKNNFVTLLETTISGSLSTQLHYSATLLKPEQIPSSNWNGTYLLKLKSVPQVNTSVNKRFEYHYIVTLSTMYLINQGDSVTSYNNAITDVETIVVNRLQNTTWQNETGSIANIELSTVNEPRFDNSNDSTYMIVDTDFNVHGFYNY